MGDGYAVMFQDFKTDFFERNERKGAFDDMVILHSEINIRRYA